MNLTEFFSTIKKYGDGSFSIPVLKEFLTTPNNPDLTNFFDLYKQDKKLASAVDSKKYAKVIGKILEDHKSYGGDPSSITGALQKNPDKMTISSMDIRNINLETERMHRFTINVSGILLYDVVDKIYDFAKELNYDLDMEIPAAKNQKLGYTDTITLYSSNNNLFNTLDFIQKVKTISNSFGDQPKYREDKETKSYYAEVLDGIAYDSYNTEQEKWNRDIIGETIIDAIDNMIVNYIADHFELYGNAEYVNYKNERVKFIREMMKQGIDVYVTFNTYLGEGFLSKNIDPDNIYLSENVREKFFGPRIKVTEQPETPLENDLFNTEDLSKAIEKMTFSLIAQSENKEKETSHTPEVAETPSSTPDSVVVGSQTSADDLIADLELQYKQEEEFVPLSETAEIIDGKNSRVLGLNPDVGRALPLNPLDFMTPMPSANLMRLDELELNRESSSIEGQNDEKEDILSVEVQGENVQNEEEKEDVISDERADEILKEFESDFESLFSGKEIGSSEEVSEDETLSEEEKEHIFAEAENILAEGGLKNESAIFEEGTRGSEEETQPNPEDESLGSSTGFGENITIPHEAIGDERGEGTTEDLNSSKEEAEKQEKSEIAAIGSVFGESVLEEIARDNGENVSEKEFSNEQLSQGDVPFDYQGEYGEDGTKELPAVINSEKNDATISLLGDYQARRAAEIQEQESSTNLEQLMKYDIRGEMGKVRIPDSNPNEQYLEQLLNPVQSGEGSNSLGEEELQRNTGYRHVPSDEEIRLAKLEQSLGSFSGQDQDKKDLLPSVIGDKSIPIEQGAAEKYLESLSQGAEERKEFVGFNLDELITEDKDAEALNPDSVFGEVTGDVERSEEGKSPAARKIEEMLQALNERQRNRDISNAQGGSEPVHKKSEMEIAMDEMLASVMDVPKRGEFTGFNENMLGESLNEEVNTAAGLLGLSSENSYNKYTPVPRTKSAEEERYDAMLRGEYREPPAVVIPDFIPSNVQKAEMSQGERYLEEQLANLANPKKLQAVTDVVEEEKRPVYVKEKSPEEEALDRLMEDALQPKDPILPKGSIRESMTGSEKEVSEISGKESYLNNLLNMAEKENNSMGSDEFKGFDDLLSEQPYLEVASSPQDLLAPVIQGVESAEEGNREIDEKESYLNALLNGVLNPSPNNKNEEDSVRRLPPYVREPSEEELRLREVERQALLPKKPLIEEEQEKDEVGVSVGEQKESAGESYLSQLLDNMDKPEEEKEFTGFSEDMSGDNSLEYVGPQGLIESSLDEKIRQVEAMEKAKNTEEKRLDAMLRGNEEGPSGTTFEGGFIGFNEEMLESSQGVVARTAEEMFGVDVQVGVAKIEDKEVAMRLDEQRLKDLLASVEETANVSKVGGEEVSEFFLGEEIELPKGKVFEQDGDSAREGIFNGFEEVFFDDGMPEEDALANAISGEGFLPLGFSMLTEEERVEMLGMESQQNEIIEKYSFLFGDKTDEVLEFVLTDADGNLLHLIDYLEDNNILMYLPEDAKVIVDGKTMERDDFIREYLIPDITANGAANFFDYLENRGIEINCDKKNGFFQGI